MVVIELKNRKADEVYDNVEQMPTFLGGNIETFRQWLMQQIRYPAEAIEAGIGGTVLIKFIIGTDGSIEPSTLEIMRSPHEILSSEVIRRIEAHASRRRQRRTRPDSARDETISTK